MRELKIKNIDWVSIIKPKKQDIDQLGEKFPKIHPLIMEELLRPTIRPKSEKYDDAIFIVLHFLDVGKEGQKHLYHEIDFVLLPETLVTIQYDSHNLLEKFWNENRDETIEEEFGQTPAHFLFYFIRGYFYSLARELDQIQMKMGVVEEKIFNDREEQTLKEAALLKKQLLDFRRTIGPQHTVFESLSAQGRQLYGERAKNLLEELSREYERIWNILENHKETLNALYDTNNSLLALKTNMAVKNLTFLALMTFIPMALTGLFSLNVFGIPLTRGNNAFWVITAFIAILTFLVYLLLRWRKLV